MTMARETPLHVHVGVFPRERHHVYASMARLTTNTLADVNTVVKVDEIRQIVHAIPADRPILAQAGAHGFKHVAVGPNLLVTVHARGSRRNTGKRADLDRGMAIPAIDTNATDVMLMAEWDRLIERCPFAADERRINDGRPAPRHRRHNENSTEYRQARNGIGRPFKYLRHRSVSAAVGAANALPHDARCLGSFQAGKT